MNYADFI